MEIISERLRDLRVLNDKSQAEIASALGITQQIYSNYEIGRNDLPLRHLLALANLYDVSTDYILGRSVYQKVPPELTAPLTKHVSVGDLVSKIASFKPGSRQHLIHYVNFLNYLEGQKKK